jgi:NAD(P)-dependent dehydrogenase (short-subunit alcohol dehydrogenase family)
LITGAAKRLGRALALALADRGFDIAVSYRSSESQAYSLGDEIRSKGVECELARRDLRDPSEAESLMEWALEAFPGLSVVVNNASVYTGGSILETEPRDLERDLALHLLSPFALVRGFAASGRGGVVVNVLDARISRSSTTKFSYLLSKKALADLTAMAAAELGPEIRVNGVAPGLILPPEGAGDACLDALAENIPAKRRGTVEEFVSAVLFLVDNEYVTGQTVFVGGGLDLVG